MQDHLFRARRDGAEAEIPEFRPDRGRGQAAEEEQGKERGADAGECRCFHGLSGARANLSGLMSWR